MSYGMSATNPGGEFVLTSDAKGGLHCIGKATPSGAVVQPTGLATDTPPGRVTGYSEYTISFPGPIVVAFDVPIGKRAGIIRASQAGSTWTIRAHCGDSADGNGFDTEYALDVWAFGYFGTIAGGFGVAIYQPDGSTVVWDLSRANPLFARAFVSAAGGVVTIPSLTRPVIVGAPATDIQQRLVATPGFNTHDYAFLRGAWLRFDATTLIDTVYTAQRYRVFGPDLLDEGGDTFTSSSFIVEGALLP